MRKPKIFAALAALALGCALMPAPALAETGYDSPGAGTGYDKPYDKPDDGSSSDSYKDEIKRDLVDFVVKDAQGKTKISLDMSEKDILEAQSHLKYGDTFVFTFSPEFDGIAGDRAEKLTLMISFEGENGKFVEIGTKEVKYEDSVTFEYKLGCDLKPGIKYMPVLKLISSDFKKPTLLPNDGEIVIDDKVESCKATSAAKPGSAGKVAALSNTGSVASNVALVALLLTAAGGAVVYRRRNA